MIIKIGCHFISDVSFSIEDRCLGISIENPVNGEKQFVVKVDAPKNGWESITYPVFERIVCSKFVDKCVGSSIARMAAVELRILHRSSRISNDIRISQLNRKDDSPITSTVPQPNKTLTDAARIAGQKLQMIRL